MKFEHWLPDRDSDANWTTVAQDLDFEKDDLVYDYFTISVIADPNEPKLLVSNYDWLGDVQFGQQTVWEYDDKVHFDFNSIDEKNDVKFQPFVIWRSWGSKSIEPKFELIQDFILFYNLYFNEQEQVYNAIKETGEVVVVVKKITKDNYKKIEVRTNFLKNYLAFKNKILVRQHDHRTRSTKSLSDLGITRFETDYIQNEYNFSLVIDESFPSITKEKSFSRLLGIDIILPFITKKHLLGWGKKYCKFIIGVTKEGDEIEETCDEKKLGNYFGKTGTHYLTSVFFKREVLKKYHDTTSKYLVTASHLSCGHLWGLPIDTNPKDLVQVYLGDLGHIPYDEQLYWRTFNVVPEGGISHSRFQRDFAAEFADPEDPMFKFTKSLTSLQENFARKYDFNLFKPLEEKDKFIENSLRIPVNNEPVEFEQQIGYLAKILPDSIDINSLRKKMKEKGVSQEKLDEIKGKPLRTLERFLENEKIDSDIIQNLNTIQQIRSAGISHRKGENYEKISQKYNLEKISPTDFFKDQISKLTKSFNDLSSKMI